jgi:small-conductance mechanosensitive channel
MQSPIVQPDTLRFEVPFPAEVARWRDLYLHDASQKLLVFVVLAVLLYLLMRVVRRQVTDDIEDINRRHRARKWIGYGYFALLALLGVALFADALAGFGTVIALIIAGVAVALQDVLKSVVAWLYISSRTGVQIGSRVEVGGVVGDVIDIGVLKTTLLEVGNLVFGRQSTGRLVSIPNHRMLSDAVFVSAADNPFVWHELRVRVTFESDWERAEQILREAGEQLHAEVAPELERGFRQLEKRFAFRYGTLTPIVYVTLGEFGVELTLRFLTHARRRRGNEDRVSRQVLCAFAREPKIEIAYPTYRAFRRGESVATGSRQPSDMVPEGAEEGLPPPDMVSGDDQVTR